VIIVVAVVVVGIEYRCVLDNVNKYQIIEEEK
jgi:hypothetical protein